jgi:hypothetical protein
VYRIDIKAQDGTNSVVVAADRLLGFGSPVAAVVAQMWALEANVVRAFDDLDQGRRGIVKFGDDTLKIGHECRVVAESTESGQTAEVVGPKSDCGRACAVV